MHHTHRSSDAPQTLRLQCLTSTHNGSLRCAGISLLFIGFFWQPASHTRQSKWTQWLSDCTVLLRLRIHRMNLVSAACYRRSIVVKSNIIRVAPHSLECLPAREATAATVAATVPLSLQLCQFSTSRRRVQSHTYSFPNSHRSSLFPVRLNVWLCASFSLCSIQYILCEVVCVLIFLSNCLPSQCCGCLWTMWTAIFHRWKLMSFREFSLGKAVFYL